jgi:hypothetical protein
MDMVEKCRIADLDALGAVNGGGKTSHGAAQKSTTSGIE